MEDYEIVNLIYNRFEDGIDELKNKYNQLLLTLASSILRNESDSEESVNDTYLKVWKTIPPYKPNFLKSFVCKLTRQISIDKYRANHRKNMKEYSLNDLDYEISSHYSVDDEFYAKELLTEAMKIISSKNVNYVEIGVMGDNKISRKMYESLGFMEYKVYMRKDL